MYITCCLNLRTFDVLTTQAGNLFHNGMVLTKKRVLVSVYSSRHLSIVKLVTQAS